MTILTVPVLLARCQALGIDLSIGPSGTLDWQADADPPAELLANLAEHKAEVFQVLRDRDAARFGTADPGQAEDVARVIEADLSLPTGSLTLFAPLRRCPGCTYCRPASSMSPDAEGTTHEPGTGLSADVPCRGRPSTRSCASAAC